MSDTPHDERPDPSRASTPAEFIAQLNRLRQWAGKPSLRTLRTLAGLRPGAGDLPSEALPTSTTHEILTGKRLPRLPRLEFVEHFVTACLRATRCPAGEIDSQVEQWRRSWRTLAEPQAQENGVPAFAQGNGQRLTTGTSIETPRAPRGLIRLAKYLVVFVVGGVTGAAAMLYVAGFPPSAEPGGPQRFECPEQPVAFSPDGEQLVVNGTFDDRKWPWWESHTLRTHLEHGGLRIIVNGRTAKPHDAIVEQRQVRLRRGRTYTLSFVLSANHAVTVRAAVQMQHEPWSAVLDEDISAGPTPCRFTITAPSEVHTDFGVVTFQLGGHENEHSYLLDDVSLVEHAEPSPP